MNTTGMDPDVAFNEFLFGLFAFAFFWCAIGAGIGAVVGHYFKGKPADGAIWGALLGLIGVFVFLGTAEDARIKCRACLSVVPQGARKCRHCGEDL